ncbi:nicotinamide mononucleotide transporter [Pseudomonas sp. gcc21]|uniref:nicotinamide riboside transporter PnuC n=1 Tax=Pseudomonas sp. gcc21 TaxID=2726989 RepID=UPI0014516563|nr:nicotinamide riboside transporter PnuC [Pseudomonas sp. gcc21]QJD58533.1 nicotinamide mononucleotide transporter [Pseudomonas sp. gcc21]
MTPLEIAAALLGTLSVWLTVRQNPLCWPVGLCMVVLYAWFFQSTGLYSQVLLHSVYAALQLYGWWQWTRGGASNTRLEVSLAGPVEIATGVALAALASLALGALMAGYTDAVYPRLDAALTAFSLLAQLAMALKRLQCWILWIVLDVMYVALFFHQGFYLTTALYVIFVLLAVLGWRQWRASMVSTRCV